MINLAKSRESAARWFTTPLTIILGKTRLKPNTVTWLGLATNMIAAIVIATNHLLIGGLLVLLSGLFDLFDGALARSTNQTTPYGGLLDSTFDRISEAVLFLGLLALYILNFTPTASVLTPMTEYIAGITLIFLALVGAFLTSYVRARAEGLKVECTVGLMQRPERIILLSLGVLFRNMFVNVNLLVIALWILVILSHITVLQRVAFVLKEFHGIRA